MANGEFDKKLEALRTGRGPKLSGRIVNRTKEVLTISAGGCLVEIPTAAVSDMTERGEEVDLSLAPDAEVVVSTLVTAGKGFVADNVFGALVDNGLVANNCNCNCNCDGGGSNCNCNCNLEANVILVEPSGLQFRRSSGL